MILNEMQVTKKIENLLLNRVEGLEWMYYDLYLPDLLKEPDPYLSHDEVREILKTIEIDFLGVSKCNNPKLTGDPSLLLRLVVTVLRIHPQIMHGVVKRLFDTNNFRHARGAFAGKLGKLNREDRKRRQKIFDKRIAKKHYRNDDFITILAEGDSWFQFPRVNELWDPVKDILDWLIEDEDLAVLSLAAGGDWFSNIIRAGEYVEELPKVDPDVFLISGGGNDLVGGRRIAIMVNKPGPDEENLRPFDSDMIEHLCNKRRRSIAKRKKLDFNENMYRRGLQFLSNEFFDFLNLYFVQYFVFLFGLATSSRYSNMIIVTQGYDYVLPYLGSRAFPLSPRWWVNREMKTGKWLAKPLLMKGIHKRADQESIMYAMITEFNEMLIQLAKSPLLGNVYHIDCRGVAEKSKDWFDEIHLKHNGYKCIARAIKNCIRENIDRETIGNQKVYLAKSYK